MSLQLICRYIRQETPTVKTFVFIPSQPISHEAGQSMSLKIPVGEGLVRTFSIASASAVDGAVEITIKAAPDGNATRWLHDVFKPGDTLEARPPAGRFTLARRRAGMPLAFVSAGSGATPLMAMLRHLAATEPEADIAWFHAARDQSEMLFAAELAELSARMPRLKLGATLSRPAPGWFGYRGRVTRRMMSVAIPDLAQRDLFSCGPEGFSEEMKLIYGAEGGMLAHFHTESFHPPAAQQAGLAAEAADGPQFQMQIGDRKVGIAKGETVLQAALRQGVIIPCGCGQGLCGTCRVELISGMVKLDHQGGISSEEERAGYILACSSRAHGDLILRI